MGPGDPELITLKAFNALKNSDFVFYPAVTYGKNKVAYEILKSLIGMPSGCWNIAEDRLIPLEVEMKRSEGRNNLLYKENALKILDKLKEGVCSYITIGDPMFYSTYWGIYNALKEEAVKIDAGLDIAVINGISSFNYALSLIGEPYVIKNSSVLITVPVKKDLGEIEAEIDFIGKKNTRPQAIVFMKAGGYLKGILAVFKRLYFSNFKEGSLRLYLIERSKLVDGFCDGELNLKKKLDNSGTNGEFDYFSILIGIFL